VKPLNPLEFPFNIALVAATAIIVISYAVFLIKLRPAIETEPIIKTNLEKKKATSVEPRSREKPTTLDEIKKITDEPPALPRKDRISVEPRKSSEKPETKVESKKEVQSKTPVEIVEIEEKKKTTKDENAKKSFFLFGDRNFEGCHHKFGFLNDLPKNTPIPDECFGCPQIVECLKNLKAKQAA
jgi:type IV secretory pathway VirB10-like protein